MADKKRILVVDDDPDTLVYLASYLEDNDYEVHRNWAFDRKYLINDGDRCYHCKSELYDRLRAVAEDRSRFANIVGRSAAMQRVFDLIERVADSDLPVLIQGESGTGKELVARAVHYNGPLSDKNFVSENCAAISENLLESELFGYEKGAFTGADRRKIGLFEAADGGTLFLDEIGEMGLTMQKKLLRVLQEGEFRRVGGREPIRVNVRILSATSASACTCRTRPRSPPSPRP